MPDDLRGYELVVGVCGGIAAYKVCDVVSGLVQRGAGVQVVMTESATQFVGPMTFQTLSSRQVFTSMWTTQRDPGLPHLELTERADLMLVAPATANILGKVANSIADDLVSTMIIGADCPVLFAPAMNTRMWENPIVQKQVKRLGRYGYLFVGPAEGRLACGTVGMGRLAGPEVILETIARQLKTDPPRARTER